MFHRRTHFAERQTDGSSFALHLFFFCYLPTPAKGIAKGHENQTTIAAEKRWPRDLFSSTCLKAMFQGEGLGSRCQQSKETQQQELNSLGIVFFFFRIHSCIHCLLCLNSALQSTPGIPATIKGNVRWALTPVQTHQRSLTTHRNSSPCTPIWPCLHFPFLLKKKKTQFSAKPGRVKKTRIAKC